MQPNNNSSNFIPTLIFCSGEIQVDRLEEIKAFFEEWYGPETYIPVATSGSTGKKKVIRAEKKHLIASANMTINHFRLKKGMKVLHCLSVSSIAGKMQLIRALVGEMDLVITDVNSAPLKNLDQQVDFAAMVPIQIETSLKVCSDRFDLIDTIIIGGAPIHHALWNSIVERHICAYQTFGMTETYSHIAVRKVSNPEIPYEVLQGVSISVNPTLVISATGLGVYQLQTNDAVELVDATHFFWKGRTDFIINSGGIKLHPEQIEFKLGEIITVPFFSIGIPDELLGSKHILCVESKVELTKDALIQHLDKFEVPKIIYFFDKFDYTHSGKIDRMSTIKRLHDAERQIL